MNITFLIGNGFDVDQNIKTSYNNFYEWYCSKSSDVKHIDSFRQNIKNDVNRDVPDEEKTWADFELGLGQYTTKFTKETVEEFLDCLEDGQGNIRTYLLKQEENFDPDAFSDEAYRAFYESIRDFFEEVPDLEKPTIKTLLDNAKGENKEVKFLSFNYTSTLERIFAKLPNQPFLTWRNSGGTYTYHVNHDILHVNGSTNEFPVLGVNDESQIANKELLETPQFKEILCKGDSVQALGRVWHQEAETQISKSRFICILGMSLGASDAKWWKKLGQWLKADGGRHLIIYWFEKNPPNSISVRKQLRTIEKVKNRFLSYSEFSTNEIETLKSRIHVVINTKKFLKLTKPEQANAIDSPVIYEPTQQAAQIIDDTKNSQGVVDAIDKYNASLPTITVV